MILGSFTCNIGLFYTLHRSLLPLSCISDMLYSLLHTVSIYRVSSRDTTKETLYIESLQETKETIQRDSRDYSKRESRQKRLYI